MGTRSTTYNTLALLGLWLTPGPAVHAQQGSPSGIAPAEQAKAKYADAIRHYTAGEWKAGIDLLEEANALYPNPALLFNIAYGYEQLGGRCVDAISAYGRYFAACADKACPELATAHAKESETRAACIGQVQVETDPIGAILTVDGKGVGTSPTTLNLSPGPHTLVASKVNRQDEQKLVEVEPGKSQFARFTLPPTQPVVPVAPSASAPEALHAVAEAPEPPDRTAVWIAFGAGGVGLATGGLFAALTSSAVQDRNRANADFIAAKSGSRSKVKGLDDDARRDQLLAFVGFGLGLAGAATGATLLLLEEQPEGAAAGTTPVAGPGYLGLCGSF